MPAPETHRRPPFAATCLLLVGLATGCLDHEGGDEMNADDPRGQFIAVQSDFQGFETWQSYEIGSRMHGGVEGAVKIYVSDLPLPGSTSFPTGTMIVKTIEAASSPNWVAHAMVKRGGSFNQSGAFGWEFFDLTVPVNRIPYINWRGLEAPAGHGYESLPGIMETSGVLCNDCHRSNVNDGILSSPLQLQTLK